MFSKFSHNNVDTIYYQENENSLKYPFLIVSEFFNTPSEGVTELLRVFTDQLNKANQE